MFTGPGLGREAFSMGRCGVTTSEFMKFLTFQQYVQERGVADIETCFTANGDPLCDTCSKQPGENHKIFQTLNVLVLAEKYEKMVK